VDTADTAQAKRQIRRDITAMLRVLSAAEKRHRADSLLRRLLELPLFRSVRFVGGYFAMVDEIGVDGVLTTALEGGKDALVPILRDEELDFAFWRPSLTLRRDRLGVLEPVTRGASRLPSGPGLLLVPGRAFDTAGRRLGRGQGFYDRVLARLPADIVTVGVGYSEQIIAKVPTALHDRPVAALATDQHFEWCSA